VVTKAITPINATRDILPSSVIKLARLAGINRVGIRLESDYFFKYFLYMCAYYYCIVCGGWSNKNKLYIHSRLFSIHLSVGWLASSTLLLP